MMIANCLPFSRPLSASWLSFPPPVEGWRAELLETPAAIMSRWPAAGREDDFWLRPALLAYLADRPQGMSTAALLLEHPPTGRRLLLTVQRFDFRPAGQVAETAKGATSAADLRRRLLGPFRFPVVVIGQLLTSGPYAAAGLGGLSDEEAAGLLPAVGERLVDRYGGTLAYLLKDLYPVGHPVVGRLLARGHYSLPGDPVMQMDLDPAWRTMDDYLAELTSKYRVRYRRARGKLKGLTRRPLPAGEVADRSAELYGLYQGMSRAAVFNVVRLEPGYFAWLAGRPGAAFQGYFTGGGELAGFTTALANGCVRHAHFLGLREPDNQRHHLYHNLLFDLLEEAILSGATTLDYGRTATEIKSSVGATPRPAATLIRGRSALLRYLIPLFTPAVYQDASWTQRHPFRAR